MAGDNLVPLTEDLLEESHSLDIFRGLENLNRMDKTIADGASFYEGDWAVLNDDDELEAPGATPKANTYPIWLGNAEGRSDVHATGKATILVSGGFLYRTSKYDDGGSYSVGDALTVKDLGGGERVPTAQSGSEPILARVFSVPANGIMEIQVLDN